MTRDLGAEVQPAIDRDVVAKRCRDLNIKIADGEKLVERTTGALATWREEIGRALIELRSTFSKRGDGFVEYVEGRIGVARTTALRYMEGVGYGPRGDYEIKPKAGLNLDPPPPTLALVPPAPSTAALLASLPREQQREFIAEIAKENPRAVAEVAREIRQSAPRRERDAYLSAGGFVRPLLSVLGSPPATLIECCAGGGDLVAPLRDAGFTVFTADLDPGRAVDLVGDATDGATWARFPPAEWVVSNLPFNEAIRILPRALAHASRGVAVILRLTFLEPVKERAEWLAAHPLTNQIVLPRYSFTGDGYTDSVTCAWMVWEHGKAPAIFIPQPDGDGMPGALDVGVEAKG